VVQGSVEDDDGVDRLGSRRRCVMADRVRKVRYCYVVVPSRAGQGAKVLGALKDAGVNMLAYSGFPVKGGKAQLDFVVESTARLGRIAKKSGWRLSKPKRAFLVQGDDKVGAVQRHVQKLADQKISIIAAQAATAGKGRYGMILWVRKKDYGRAARALRAK
jgi:hypothetical protein